MRRYALIAFTLCVMMAPAIPRPAHADLIGKTVDPADRMTRGDDDDGGSQDSSSQSGAQVDSFWDSLGKFARGNMPSPSNWDDAKRNSVDPAAVPKQ